MRPIVLRHHRLWSRNLRECRRSLVFILIGSAALVGYAYLHGLRQAGEFVVLAILANAMLGGLFFLTFLSAPFDRIVVHADRIQIQRKKKTREIFFSDVRAVRFQGKRAPTFTLLSTYGNIRIGRSVMGSETILEALATANPNLIPDALLLQIREEIIISRNTYAQRLEHLSVRRLIGISVAFSLLLEIMQLWLGGEWPPIPLRFVKVFLDGLLWTSLSVVLIEAIYATGLQRTTEHLARQRLRRKITDKARDHGAEREFSRRFRPWSMGATALLLGFIAFFGINQVHVVRLKNGVQLSLVDQRFHKRNGPHALHVGDRVQFSIQGSNYAGEIVATRSIASDQSPDADSVVIRVASTQMDHLVEPHQIVGRILDSAWEVLHPRP